MRPQILVLEDRLTPSGWLDPTFGTSGIVRIPDRQYTPPDAVAVQPDGRILMYNDGILRRFNPDGSPDASFGGGDGVVDHYLSPSYSPGFLTAMIAPGPGNSIMLLGTESKDGSPERTVIVRLRGDGELDSSFDGDGRAYLPGTAGHFDSTTFFGLTVLPDGGVAVVGAKYPSQVYAALAVARLTAAGAPDTVFGPDGLRTYYVGSYGEGNQVFPGPDGSVLVVGRAVGTISVPAAAPPLPYQYHAVVARITAYGELDPAFGEDGLSIVPLNGASVEQLTAARTPDGRLVLGLNGGTPSNPDPYNGTSEGASVVRLMIDGSLDSTFGSGGILDLTGTVAQFLQGLALLPDGRTVVYGHAADGIQLTALQPNGLLDSSFGTNGGLLIPAAETTGFRPPFPGSPPFAPVESQWAAATPDGRVVLLGQLHADNNLGAIAVVDPDISKDHDQPAATLADVNGDGVADAIVPNGRRVLLRDGATGKEALRLVPFEPTYSGSVSVATADIDRDGLADVIVTPGSSGSGRVNVYRGSDLVGGRSDPFFCFFGIEDTSFRGGALAAFGDVNGDGVPDLIVAAGEGGGPRIAVYDGTGLEIGSPTPPKLTGDFFAFETALRDGATVAAGDLTGDGVADLVLGAGLGGAPRVRVFDGKALLAAGPFSTADAIVSAAGLADFFAGEPSARQGVRVAMHDVDTDGVPELLTQAANGQRVRVYLKASVLGNSGPDFTLDPRDPALPSGVFVG